MARPDPGIFRLAASLPSTLHRAQPERTEICLFIANRGEIAVRILDTVQSTALPSHVITPLVPYTRAELSSAAALAVPPTQRVLLPLDGSAAYLDIPTLIDAAQAANAHAVIPGYGFLSESAAFAQAVQDAGMLWVGPDPTHLDTFGNKLQTRQLAEQLGVPVVPATGGSRASQLDLAALEAFAKSLPNRSKVLLKAVAGGGGRGMRLIDVETQSAEEISQIFASCSREAQTAFGNGALFAELLVENARHIEVQIIGDGSGNVAHLWERECTLQRRHQKLVEWAPSPTLRPSSDLRASLLDAALRLASAVKYKSLGTFEFLVLPDTDEFFFMEANPRIQVEHTVTEQVTGLDLVAIQLRVALGESIASIGLAGPSAPAGVPFPQHFAVQLRINAEQVLSTGDVQPSGGTLTAFSPPTGRNIRVDTAAHAPRPLDGKTIVYSPSPAFDSLLAKLIVSGSDYSSTLAAARNALGAFTLGGVETNREFLSVLLAHPDVVANEVHTRFVDVHAAAIVAAYLPASTTSISTDDAPSTQTSAVSGASGHQSGTKERTTPPGIQSIPAPLAATVVSIDVKAGEAVRQGQQVAVLSAMKMENVVRSTVAGVVEAVLVRQGDVLLQGQAMLDVRPDDSSRAGKGAQHGQSDESASDVDSESTSAPIDPDLDAERPDLERYKAAKALIHNGGRETAVQRRHRQGYLTARENIAALVDEGSFKEWGDFAVPAQRNEQDLDQLQARGPGDGILVGWATINERLLLGKEPRYPSPARVALAIGDYLTQAGTQGYFHHQKLDRIFKLVLQNPSPLILYAEGGGGRPNDLDLLHIKTAHLDTPSFHLLALIKVRGLPTIGVAHQYVFAGNAALFGTCDVTIATRGSAVGMGGPAMIEGGGLGKVKAREVGPVEMHAEKGHIDLLVENEREAAELVKRVLLYFQGPLPLPDPSAPRCTSDQRLLRHILPESRTRSYDVRRIIRTLADNGSFLELGERCRTSLITGFMHVEGTPLAVIASDVSTSSGGAIDVPAAQKAVRFLQLLTRTTPTHLLVLADTPGFAIGPAEDERGGVRAFADLFAAYAAFGEGGGRILGVVVRKGYGLAVEALMGGSTMVPAFCAAWPGAEMAGMNIEGAVALGMRKHLEAIEDAAERQELFDTVVSESYERGRAESMASKLEVDTVIDPAETRGWVCAGLRGVGERVPRWMRESGIGAARL